MQPLRIPWWKKVKWKVATKKINGCNGRLNDVARTSVTSIIVWKWIIHNASSSAMFKSLHHQTNQENCMKSTFVINMGIHYENMNVSTQVPCPLIIVWKVKYSLHFIAAMLNLLYSSTNQKLPENLLCNHHKVHEMHTVLLYYNESNN